MTILQNHLISTKSQPGCWVFYKEAKKLKLALYLIIIYSLLALSAEAMEVNYKNALELKQQGDFAKSEQYFNELLKKDNTNSEYWFQIGLLQRFQEKNQQALSSLAKASELSPKNHDITLELARQYSRNQNFKVADSLLNKVLTDQPNYQAAADLKANIERLKNAPKDQRPFKWLLTYGYENSDFKRIDQPNWHQHFVNLGYRKQNSTFHFKMTNYERRKIHNEQYEIGVNHKFNNKRNGEFSVGYSPDALFISRWHLKAGGQAKFIDNHQYIGDSWLTGLIDYKHFRTIDVVTFKAGIRYFITDNLRIYPQFITIKESSNNPLHGWSARVDWNTPIRALRLSAGLSDAPETENAVTINTRAFFVGASYRFTPRITLYTYYSREDRENSYIRNIVTAALLIKF